MSKKRGRDTDCTEMVLNAIGESGSGVYKHFQEHLGNKSIVLKNTSAQLHASKASTRAKSNAARVGKVSRRGLKCKKLLGTDPKGYTVEERDVRRTHHLWKQFIDTVVQSCSNDLQLRTKLYEAGLLGAYITRVVKENDNEEEGVGRKRKRRWSVSGFVVNETRNCLFIAVLPETERQEGPPSKQQQQQQRRQKEKEKDEGVVIKRVLKAPNMFAVQLPSNNSSASRGGGKVMLLHGKQLLPLKGGKSFGT